MTILDRRGMHPHPRLYSAERSPRPWTGRGPRVIRGVTLHQTGIDLSDRPGRWDTLNAHVAVLTDGTIIICNDPTDFIWHAQGLSHSTIGVEFDGNFPGITGRLDTLWGEGWPAAVLTPAQLEAADELFGWIMGWFGMHSGVWSTVHAHRQAVASRRSDPGQEIWQRVGLPWLERAGATDGGPGWVVPDSTGRPIPREWDPAREEEY